MNAKPAQAGPEACGPRRAAKAGTDQPQSAGALEVLLVEDDAADTELILKVLRRHPQVAHAQSTDAPDFVLRQLQMGRLKPDLVLLNLRLPRLDGFTFLSRLRDTAALSDLPVVFLTSSNLPNDVRRARASSAARYVVKPDSYAELRLRLNGVVEQAVIGDWSQGIAPERSDPTDEAFGR